MNSNTLCRFFRVPDECELKPLDLSRIPLMHSVWPHRNKDHPEISEKFLETVTRLNGGVGLFLKKDDSLVSWVLHSDWGGLLALQTLDEHKGKGYGKIVVQAIIKQLAENENLDSVLFVVENNIAPEKIFASLGYKRLTPATWYYIKSIKN